MDNILELHQELMNKTYQHGPYHAFKISDPKPRSIHKANVRDRLLHHAIHRILYPYFDKKFIHESCSCRIHKGTLLALNQFLTFARKVSRNDTRITWILKCDIRKFFANIDHQILKKILEHQIEDNDILWLLDMIIDSFHTVGKSGIGLPLGNLTSQLLINVYMNEFDQFVKHNLKIRYYIRYADDFIIIHENKSILVDLVTQISDFLKTKLKLTLHQNKLFIKTFDSGVDFLGWVHFPHHRVLRTATKRRILNKLQKKQTYATLASYSGLLRHGDTYKLTQIINKEILLYF